MQAANSPETLLNVPFGSGKLRVKRDDMLLDFLGGNKVRKNTFILKALPSLPEVIITTGSTSSNHARVCALMAARLGIKCHLVLHGTSSEPEYLHGNSFLLRCSDAKVDYVAADQIANSINAAERHYVSRGLKVLVIPGGAHSLEGAKAYMEAVNEVVQEPDYIVLPSGTGATQAGVLAGVRKRTWKTKVIGISVARPEARGVEAINEIYKPLCKTSNLLYDVKDIHFVDEFRFGGYGKYNREILDFISSMICYTGIPFDPVYTGKALFGLRELISRGEIQSNKSVLFWHTGGLLNLQSSRVL